MHMHVNIDALNLPGSLGEILKRADQCIEIPSDGPGRLDQPGHRRRHRDVPGGPQAPPRLTTLSRRLWANAGEVCTLDLATAGAR